MGRECLTGCRAVLKGLNRDDTQPDQEPTTPGSSDALEVSFSGGELIPCYWLY